jgi:endonuclease YncB( thermonuclease family)
MLLSPATGATVRRVLVLVCAVSAFLAVPSTASATHGVDAECTDFQDQSHAQDHLLAHPGDPDELDPDGDGRACELLPCPCGATGGPAPPPMPTPAPQPGSSRTVTGRVIRVIDGQTLRVRLTSGRHETVRLIGIDTPKSGTSGTPVECGGIEATGRMKRLAIRRGRGRIVTLKSDPTQDVTDRYGRMLAYASAAGVDFGRVMTASGWAKTYVFEREFQRLEKYRAAEESARSAGRGVWRKCGGDFHRQRPRVRSSGARHASTEPADHPGTKPNQMEVFR